MIYLLIDILNIISNHHHYYYQQKQQLTILQKYQKLKKKQFA